VMGCGKVTNFREALCELWATVATSGTCCISDDLFKSCSAT